MNYDQARQLGEESDAPGKWNWSTMNDGVIRTAPPCWFPDFVWPKDDPEGIITGKIRPSGRPRCDHDTREEAERHHWRHEIDNTEIRQIDLDAARERRRCDYPGCPEWETYRSHVRGWGYGDSMCDAHANRASLGEMHPFHPGTRVIHS